MQNKRSGPARRTAALRIRLQDLNRFQLAEEMTQVDTAEIVRELDTEIARLTSARKILSGSDVAAQPKRQPKRAVTTKAPKAKRVSRLSAAGRKKLSELMKKRWAERRKKAGSKAK